MRTELYIGSTQTSFTVPGTGSRSSSLIGSRITEVIVRPPVLVVVHAPIPSMAISAAIGTARFIVLSIRCRRGILSRRPAVSILRSRCFLVLPASQHQLLCTARCELDRSLQGCHEIAVGFLESQGVDAPVLPLTSALMHAARAALGEEADYLEAIRLQERRTGAEIRG